MNNKYENMILSEEHCNIAELVRKCSNELKKLISVDKPMVRKTLVEIV